MMNIVTGDDTGLDVDVTGTWNMTVTLAGYFGERFEVPLSGRRMLVSV